MPVRSVWTTNILFAFRALGLSSQEEFGDSRAGAIIKLLGSLTKLPQIRWLATAAGMPSVHAPQPLKVGLGNLRCTLEENARSLRMT